MLLPAAIPRLRPLRASGLTVALGVLWREHVCYLLHARPPITIEDGIGRHELWPVGHTSLGIALLAGAPPTHAKVCRRQASGVGASRTGERRVRKRDERETTDIHVLDAPVETPKPLLKSVRQQGGAVLLFPNGEYSVGAAIGRPSYAALGVSGVRSKRRAIGLLPRIRQIADEINEEMNR
jgi:DNA-binding IclR family transcriptional regulator